MEFDTSQPWLQPYDLGYNSSKVQPQEATQHASFVHVLADDYS